LNFTFTEQNEDQKEEAKKNSINMSTDNFQELMDNKSKSLTNSGVSSRLLGTNSFVEEERKRTSSSQRCGTN